MINLSLRQLRALTTIDREGRIVSAARVLGLTAPAVTLQVKQLEDEMGMTLFDRTTHGMRPTAAGEAAIRAAEDVFVRLSQLEREMDAIRGARKGSLRVGVVSTAGYFAARLVEAFARECPEVGVDLFVGRRPEIMMRLKNYESDLVLAPRPPEEVSVRALPFAEYRLVVVASPRHPLAGRRGVSRKELLTARFILRERGTGLRLAADSYLAGGGGPAPRPYMEMTSHEQIIRAVAEELGVAFVPTHVLAQDKAARRLVTIDAEGLPLVRQWFAITRANRAPTPAMDRFQAFLVLKGSQYLQQTDVLYAHD